MKRSIDAVESFETGNEDKRRRTSRDGLFSFSFVDLIADVKNLIIRQYLDPASRCSLSLTCRDFYENYFEDNMYGENFPLACARSGHERLLDYALLGLRCPFHLETLTKEASKFPEDQSLRMASYLLSKLRLNFPWYLISNLEALYDLIAKRMAKGDAGADELTEVLVENDASSWALMNALLRNGAYNSIEYIVKKSKIADKNRTGLHILSDQESASSILRALLPSSIEMDDLAFIRSLFELLSPRADSDVEFYNKIIDEEIFMLLASVRVSLMNHPRLLQHLVLHATNVSKTPVDFPNPTLHMRSIQMHKLYSKCNMEGLKMLYASAGTLALVQPVYQIIFAHGIKFAVETLNMIMLDQFLSLSRDLLDRNFVDNVIAQFVSSSLIARNATSQEEAERLRHKFGLLLLYIQGSFPGLLTTVYSNMRPGFEMTQLNLITNGYPGLFEDLAAKGFRVPSNLVENFVRVYSGLPVRGESPLGVYFIFNFDLLETLMKDKVVDETLEKEFRGLISSVGDHNTLFFKFTRAILLLVARPMEDILNKLRNIFGDLFMEFVRSMPAASMEALIHSILKRNVENQLRLTVSLRRLETLFLSAKRDWPRGYSKEVISRYKRDLKPYVREEFERFGLRMESRLTESVF